MPRNRTVDTHCDFVSQGSVFQCSTCGAVVCEPRRQICEQKYDPAKDTGTGVGSQLSRILHRFGINPKPGCSCHELRRRMNELGPDGCESELDSLAEELRRQAVKRGWLFSSSTVTLGAAKRVIQFAIWRARRADG